MIMPERKTRPPVMSIAGFDPSGGAGILADIKTFEATCVYGFGVVTALTYQNDINFHEVEWLTVKQIIRQADIILERFPVKHFKIGIIKDNEKLMQILQFLRNRVEKPIIILDPITAAHAGFVFHKSDAIQLSAILPDIYCLTPNYTEAIKLFGEEMLESKLTEISNICNIYLKGGHKKGRSCEDIIYFSGEKQSFINPRLEKGEKHGSGCVLSSALTAQLALGKSFADACQFANKFTYNFLQSSTTLLGNYTFEKNYELN